MQYRNIPLLVEAFQLTLDSRVSVQSWPAWLRLIDKDVWEINAVSKIQSHREDGPLRLSTKRVGMLHVKIGDWFVRYPDGTIEAMTPENFANTFELVEDRKEVTMDGLQSDEKTEPTLVSGQQVNRNKQVPVPTGPTPGGVDEKPLAYGEVSRPK